MEIAFLKFIMKIFSIISRNAGNILWLLFLIVLFFIISALIIVLSSREFVINRWDQFRCDPFYSTFARFYGKDPIENSKVCGQSGFGALLGGKLSPFGQISEMLNSTLGDLGNVFSDLDQFGLGMVSFISGLATKFVETIRNLMGTALFLFMKLKSVLGKIYGIFAAVLYAMYSGIIAMESLANGPIGSFVGGGGREGGRGPGGRKNWATIWMETMKSNGLNGGGGLSQSTRDKLAEAPSMDQACCFGAGTKIKMEKGHSLEIEKVNIGDIVEGGGEVLGCYHFLVQKSRMSLWRGVVVAKTHLYYPHRGTVDDSQFSDSTEIRVGEMEGDLGRSLEGDELIDIYCLTTQSHIITVESNTGLLVFADFIEYHDPEYIHRLRISVDNYLGISNNLYKSHNSSSRIISTGGSLDCLLDYPYLGKIDMEGNSHDTFNSSDDMYACGWGESTPILVYRDNKWSTILISQIRVGDKVKGLDDNNIVTGKIYQYSPYNNYLWRGMILSGDQIVRCNMDKTSAVDNKNRVYSRVKNCPGAHFLGCQLLCCLATSEGIVIINDTLFRDYWEVDDSGFWDRVEDQARKLVQK